jgi:hypothetical protein
MDEGIRYRGRGFTVREIDEIKEIIATHPDKSRWFLSREICRRWGWSQPNGVLKDMVCRGLLLRLATAGLIQLPPCRQKTPYLLAHRKKPVLVQIDQTPLQGSLSELKPIELIQVRRTPWEDLYRGLMEQHHYLGYTRPVGEHWEYMAFSQGRVLACLGFCSAPRHIGCRDRYLGWTKEQRVRNLSRVVMNTRFLILPWVMVPHLASHLLGKVARRINSDWERVYGHELVWLETFVDPARGLRGLVIRRRIGFIWGRRRGGGKTIIRTGLIGV